MSRTFHHSERRIRVRAVRKDPSDLRRLARALIELAKLQAEAEAEVEHERKTGTWAASHRQEPDRNAKADHGDAA
jgi:hypothetical protein